MFPYVLRVTMCLNFVTVQALISHGLFVRQSGIKAVKVSEGRTFDDVISCGVSCLTRPGCSNVFYNEVTKDCIVKEIGTFRKSKRPAGYQLWHLQDKMKRYIDNKFDLPKGYIKITEGEETMIVKFHNLKTTWEKAVPLCEEEGGFLVMPKTDKEHAIVTGFMNRSDVDSRKSFGWIGLAAKPTRTHNYAWIDGCTPMNPRWLDGEPSSKLQNCVRLKYDNEEGWGWSDTTCFTTRTFLCQYTPN